MDVVLHNKRRNIEESGEGRRCERMWRRRAESLALAVESRIVTFGIVVWGNGVGRCSTSHRAGAMTGTD
jgi:hypothetical protein